MLQNLLGFRYPNLNFKTQPRVETITATELAARLDSPNAPLVVDVRSQDEYAYHGHITGARLLPLPMLPARHTELPKDRPLVFVCRSGNRSQVACEQLMQLGYTNTINLAGGMISWQRAGLPTQ